MRAPVSTRRREAGRHNSLVMLAIAKDVAAFAAVAGFIIAMAMWGSGLEQAVLTARGQ